MLGLLAHRQHGEQSQVLSPDCFKVGLVGGRKEYRSRVGQSGVTGVLWFGLLAGICDSLIGFPGALGMRGLEVAELQMQLLKFSQRRKPKDWRKFSTSAFDSC